MRGIGTDIIEISRIRSAIQRHSHHFLNKLFTGREQYYCNQYKDPVPHFAGRFAAKEAVIKALRLHSKMGLSWMEIEICPDPVGAPIVNLSSRLQEHFQHPHLLISISHCREYATATALLI